MSVLQVFHNPSRTHWVGYIDGSVVWEEHEGYKYVQPNVHYSTKIVKELTEDQMKELGVGV